MEFSADERARDGNVDPIEKCDRTQHKQPEHENPAHNAGLWPRDVGERGHCVSRKFYDACWRKTSARWSATILSSPGFNMNEFMVMMLPSPRSPVLNTMDGVPPLSCLVIS